MLINIYAVYHLYIYCTHTDLSQMQSTFITTRFGLTRPSSVVVYLAKIVALFVKMACRVYLLCINLFTCLLTYSFTYLFTYLFTYKQFYLVFILIFLIFITYICRHIFIYLYSFMMYLTKLSVVQCVKKVSK